MATDSGLAVTSMKHVKNLPQANLLYLYVFFEFQLVLEEKHKPRRFSFIRANYFDCQYQTCFHTHTFFVK